MISSFFFNRAVYEIMWKNIVELDGQQGTIWRLHISCWIPKATSTRSEYVTLTAFSLQLWLHERASMLRYTYIACVVTSCLSIASRASASLSEPVIRAL